MIVDQRFGALGYGWLDTSGTEHAAAAGDVDCTLHRRVEPETGDVVLRVDATSPATDIGGTFVRLEFDAAKQLVLPALNGIRFGPDHNLMPDFVYSWPTMWNAAFMWCDGVMVHIADPDDRPKSLRLTRLPATHTITIRTEQEGPLAGKRLLTGLEVRLSEASDSEAIARYQQWIAWRRGAPAPHRWVHERLHLYASHTDHDPKVVRALAAAVEPAGVLVHLSNWRKDLYDCNYPDYTPRGDVAAAVDLIHELGMRVIPHVNSWGIDMDSPLLAEFEDVWVTEAFTGERRSWQGYAMPDGSTIGRIAYVHPGSVRWRDLLVERIAHLFDSVPFDGIYLDQSSLGMNHAGGRVDGMTVAQGMAALHAQVREIVPLIAGEGMNEVIVSHQSLCEIAFLGFMPGAGWQMPAADVERMVCDVNDRLFGPWAIGAGHMPFDGEYGGGIDVVRCWARMGLVPAIPHASVDGLAHPSPSMAQVLQAARTGARLGAVSVAPTGERYA